MKAETNLKEVIEKVSRKANIAEASILSLFNFQASSELSDKLGINHADLDAVLSGESNYNFSDIFDLTHSELDNLLVEFDKQIIIGLIIGKLLSEN